VTVGLKELVRPTIRRRAAGLSPRTKARLILALMNLRSECQDIEAWDQAFKDLGILAALDGAIDALRDASRSLSADAERKP